MVNIVGTWRYSGELLGTIGGITRALETTEQCTRSAPVERCPIAKPLLC